MTDKTQEELQRIWDTCLLQYWRSAGKIFDAIEEFNKQTGKNITECSLLRIPPLGYPWQVSMRVFVAERLEKIGNRMWDMSQERDKALIDKLQTSKYDTSKQNLSRDPELQKQQKEHRKNKQKIRLDVKKYSDRNQKTDWRTVK